MDKKLLEKLMLIITIVGILDASYLTYAHYTNTSVACPDTGIINCANVLNSNYAILLGAPLTLWGLLFFLAELGLILIYKNKDALIIYNGIGLAFVFYFLFIEYTLGNICLYCTLAHICVVLLLILSIIRQE